jgi:hypothetical protein
MTRWAFLAIALELCGCRNAKVEKCRAFCVQKYGGSDEMCKVTCTRPCSELHSTYGMNEKQCTWLQNGGEGPER